MSIRLAPTHYSTLLVKHPPRSTEDISESGEVRVWTHRAIALYAVATALAFLALGAPLALIGQWI